MRKDWEKLGGRKGGERKDEGKGEACNKNGGG